MTGDQQAILIIDDDALHARSVADLLADRNAAVACTTSAVEGLDAVRAGDYDVLILDLNMPDLSGWEVLQSIRDEPVKTIVLSGERELSQVSRILGLGAYDYLPKPFEPERLVTSVANALERNALERRNRDIEAQMATEARLHEFLVNNSPDLIYMLDNDGNFSFINNSLKNIFDIDSTDVVGRSWRVLMPGARGSDLEYRFNERRTGGRATRNLELDYEDPARGSRVLDLSARGVYDNGTFAGTYGVLRDVTESRLTARALAQSEARYHGLFMHSPLAKFISRVDDGRILERNGAFGAFEESIGVSPTADAFIWPSPADRDRFVERLAASPDRYEQAVENRFAGTARHLRLIAVMLTLDSQPAMQVTIVDRTQERVEEQRRLALESQLSQASKMEAIGELAGGIAHDFNNILASIIGYTELVAGSRDRIPEHKVDEYLAEVIAAGRRARDLISQMLSFTRANRSEPRALDLSATIEDVSRMLRAAIPATIDMRTLYAADLPHVMADPVRLQQILMNLLINARDAIDGHGSIQIEVHGMRGACVCDSCSEVADGRFVVLSVRDTGHGISPDAMPRIFDRYFTTREAGKGTGIGLWQIDRLVHEYGGHLTVTSVVGDGTEFRIMLPEARPEAAERPAPVAQGGAPGRVLVVDDEVSVASFIAEVLRDAGHDVVVFNESPAAFRYLQSHGDDVALVITDRTMPTLTGMDIAELVKTVRRSIPVIMITAFAKDADKDPRVRKGVDRLLNKPFQIDDLMATVVELLEPERD